MLKVGQEPLDCLQGSLALLVGPRPPYLAWSCGTKDASNLLFLCIFQAMLCIELQKAQLGCIVLQPALIKGLSCARNFFICPDI